MGSVSSKAARKLPKAKPSLPAGTRTPSPATTAHQRPEKPLAFESRNEVRKQSLTAIEKDAKDPHFMQKLSQLGAVRVDHRMQTVRTASDVQNMYRSRMRSEAEAASVTQATQNRLLASSLAELLEERKSVANRAELDALARRYRVDVATLGRVSRCVNTPSVDERTVVWTTDKHGEESVTMLARWVDPVLSRA